MCREQATTDSMTSVRMVVQCSQCPRPTPRVQQCLNLHSVSRASYDRLCNVGYKAGAMYPGSSADLSAKTSSAQAYAMCRKQATTDSATWESNFTQCTQGHRPIFRVQQCPSLQGVSRASYGRLCDVGKDGGTVSPKPQANSSSSAVLKLGQCVESKLRLTL